MRILSFLFYLCRRNNSEKGQKNKMGTFNIKTNSSLAVLNIAFLSLFVFVSCNQSNQKETVSPSIKNLNPLDSDQSDSINVIDNSNPEVYLFKYSECIQNCEYEKIYSKKCKGDTLLIKLGAIQNCIGKFKIEIHEKGSILDLKIDVKEELVKRKDGKIDTLIVLTECECFYNFEIGIKNINKKYKTILVNGQRLTRKSINYIDDLIDTTTIDYIKEHEINSNNK
ncbi:MAG TPA: hypothetical protein PLM70_03720 [Bacteroidales bacterium]|nr:hypothetical protein [Bacteroidales bacterium]